MDEDAAVVNLPDCLIIEIFSRLPVKSICRFRCVSKFCLSFTQDPHFIDKVRIKPPILWQIQSDNDIFVYSVDSNGLCTLKHTYSFGDDIERLGFNGRYCNGLNCYVYDGDLGLRVCNVATKECIRLPRWCTDCIFCFDPSSNKYKLLGWAEKKNVVDVPLDFKVLTLERDPSWRSIRNPLQLEFLLDPEVVINGVQFWLDIYGDEQIISFNSANEEFRAIRLPNEVNKVNFWYCIFEFDGYVSLVEQLRGAGPTFSLWILNGDRWVVVKNLTLPFETTNLYERFSRNMDEWHTTPGLDCWRVDNLNFSSRGGEIVVTIMEDFDYQFIFVYNFLNDQFSTIKVTGLPFCGFTFSNYAGIGLRLRNYEENYVSIQDLISGTEVSPGEDSSAVENYVSIQDLFLE